MIYSEQDRERICEEALMSLPIDRICHNRRTRNLFCRNGIFTIGDLMEYGEESAEQIKGIGVKGMVKVRMQWEALRDSTIADPGSTQSESTL